VREKGTPQRRNLVAHPILYLLDHQTHPAQLLAQAYRWRWDGSETALREAKSTIAGAGPATGAILRSHTPELIHQEHAAWITGHRTHPRPNPLRRRRS
jgi:hypothetical protein